MIGTIQRDVTEFLMTTYEQLKEEGRQEGLQEGRQEGLQKGASRILIRLPAKKFQANPDDFIPFLGKINTEQQEELVERILESQDLDEVVAWLELVCRN